MLVSIHAFMIGEDFELNIMKVLALATVTIVIVTFINKRFGGQDKKKYKKSNQLKTQTK